MAQGATMNWEACQQSVKAVQLKGDLTEDVKRTVKRLLKDSEAPSILAGLSVSSSS